MFRQADTARKARGATLFPTAGERTGNNCTKDGGNSGKNDGQIGPHQPPDLVRHLQKDPNSVQTAKDTRLRTTATPAMRTKEETMLSRRPASSRRPNRMENRAPLPMQPQQNGGQEVMRE